MSFLIPFLSFILPLLAWRWLAPSYFYNWLAAIANQASDLNTDTIKVALFAPGAPTPPTTADATFDTVTTHTLNSSGATEVANGNGYTAGGNTCTGTSYSQTGGTATLAATVPIWTGASAGFTFRYVVAYDATAGSAGARNVIMWWDYGSTASVAASATVTVTFASGIFTMTHG